MASIDFSFPIGALIERANKDKDVISCFFFGDDPPKGQSEGAILVIKNQQVAEQVVRELEQRNLTSPNLIPE